MRKVPRNVNALLITADPGRRPRKLRLYVRSFDDPQIFGLTGTDGRERGGAQSSGPNKRRVPLDVGTTPWAIRRLSLTSMDRSGRFVASLIRPRQAARRGRIAGSDL